MERLTLEIGLAQPEIDRIYQLIVASKIHPETFKFFVDDQKLVFTLRSIIAENTPKEG